MRQNKADMLKIVRRQLAIDMNCEEQDFLRDGTIFCETRLNPGRRMFDRQTPYLETLTMGKAVVVSGDADILEKARPLLEGKSRDDVLSAPIWYGQPLYYIPDKVGLEEPPLPRGFIFGIKEGASIQQLYQIPGFQNAIQYDASHPRPDVIAVYAMKGEEMAAMAGASADSALMWQIGIDVLPAYRDKGLAVCLVSRLARMIMDRGIVPYYGTATSNIASQAVSHRSGFAPAWMGSYRHAMIGSPYEQNFPIHL